MHRQTLLLPFQESHEILKGMWRGVEQCLERWQLGLGGGALCRGHCVQEQPKEEAGGTAFLTGLHWEGITVETSH